MHAEKPTGNPVFDFKAGFRAKAQSLQRISFCSGILLIVAGIAARFISIKDAALAATLRWSPGLGAAVIVLSVVWGYLWRSKLRRDFRREFSTSASPPSQSSQ